MDFAFLILFHLTSPHPRFPLSPPTPFVTWPTTSSIICLLTFNHTSNYLPLPIFLMIIQISFIHLHRLWNRRHPWLSFLHWMAHPFFLLMPFHMAYPSPPPPPSSKKDEAFPTYADASASQAAVTFNENALHLTCHSADIIHLMSYMICVLEQCVLEEQWELCINSRIGWRGRGTGRCSSSSSSITTTWCNWDGVALPK